MTWLADQLAYCGGGGGESWIRLKGSRTTIFSHSSTTNFLPFSLFISLYHKYEPILGVSILFYYFGRILDIEETRTREEMMKWHIS